LNNGNRMETRNTSRKTVRISKELRQNMTDAEIKLWSRIRAHQLDNVHFRRQHAIGKYVVDFCAPRKKLIIEVDGGQHLDQAEYDAERTAYLEPLGYRVIRFWNHEVFGDIEPVLEAIWSALRND
jgi:very-short-patch-repair endonuclease